MFVSRPIFGRVSQRWTVQLSYPLYQDQTFAGVVVVSVPVEYISDYFRQVFASADDVAVLLYADGEYVARSAIESEVMGQKVPSDRPYLTNTSLNAGLYEAVEKVDGAPRLYAWHRVDNYPLLVSIGLNKAQALQGLQALHRTSVQRSVLGSILCLLLVLWVAGLFVRLKNDQVLLEESRQRFKLALQGGELGSWGWDARIQQFQYDQAWADMLGYQADELGHDPRVILNLVHPDDQAHVRRLARRCLLGRDLLFTSEHRMRHKNGHWVWVSARGGITSRAEDHRALKMDGIQADVTAQKEDAHLREALFDNSAAAIVLTHPTTRLILQSNRRADEVFSVTGRPLVGTSMRTLHQSDAAFTKMSEIYTLLQGQGQAHVEVELVTRQGDLCWYAIHGTLLDRQQPRGPVIWTLLDVTQQRKMAQNLADARVRLTQVIENFPGGVLVEDENGKVLVINQGLCNLLFLGKEAATLLDVPVTELTASLGPQDAHFLHQHLPLGIQTDEHRSDLELEYRDRVLQISVIPIWRNDVRRGRLWTLNDITDQRLHESHLNRLATTDALTGLPNRAAFLSRLELELDKPPAERQGVLLMADLDHFKRVNDTYGHVVGDEVLQGLAKILRQALRPADMPGRIGGEEFAILLPGVMDAAAWPIAERVREEVASHGFMTSQGKVEITISIGMARLDVGDATEILSAADAALYKAKRSGRNRVEADWQTEVLMD